MQIGEVYSIDLGSEEGITPHKGFDSRRKYMVILGFANGMALVGGVVFNSNINPNIPATARMYHYPVNGEGYSFLNHDSFIDCTTIVQVGISRLSQLMAIGYLKETDLVLVIGAVAENPHIPIFLKQRYGIGV